MGRERAWQGLYLQLYLTRKIIAAKLILIVEDNNINRRLKPGRFKYSPTLDWNL